MKLGLACRSTFSLKAIMSLAMSYHLYCNVAQKKEKKIRWQISHPSFFAVWKVWMDFSLLVFIYTLTSLSPVPTKLQLNIQWILNLRYSPCMFLLWIYELYLRIPWLCLHPVLFLWVFHVLWSVIVKEILFSDCLIKLKYFFGPFFLRFFPTWCFFTK